MAIVERGKGKRKQVFEIVRLGPVLRSQETEGGDQRLPGYRRFHDDAAAIAALADEVRAHLEDGLQPADEEARAIAAAQPAASGPPALPLRRDLGIYNEATGLVITSRRMAGKTLDEGSPGWKKAVGRGDLLPLMLIQDDPFIIRVVAGEALTEAEAGEWVSRVDAHLNIPDGKLCVTGGSIFSNDDYDADDPSYEQYVGEVAVPSGRYRATLYTHLHGVNGGGVMDHLAGGYGKGEPLDEWFARTRPGATKPAWDEQELVEFLLHLEPIEAAPKTGLSDLPADGWFGGLENARKPEPCPLGIVAKDVVRRRPESAGNWTYVYDVSAQTKKAEPMVLTGGAVSLPLASIGRAARIGARMRSVELRVSLPVGAGNDLGGAWPEGVVTVVEGAVVRIMFDSDLMPAEVNARLGELVQPLSAMPKGSVLDLCGVPIARRPGEPEDSGVLVLRGPLNGSHWDIDSAYPPVSASDLASVLAADAAVGSAVDLAGDDEADEDDDDGDGMFPAKPVQGALIYTAPGGRTWHQTMALLISEDVDAGVRKQERGLIASGFKPIGDLMTPEFDEMAFRGYARQGGDTVAWFRVSAPAEVECELISVFPGGAVLVTSPDGNASDDAAAKTYRQGFAGAVARDLAAHHQNRVAELSATLGVPQPFTHSLKGLAEALEARLLKSSF